MHLSFCDLHFKLVVYNGVGWHVPQISEIIVSEINTHGTKFYGTIVRIIQVQMC